MKMKISKNTSQYQFASRGVPAVIAVLIQTDRELSLDAAFKALPNSDSNPYNLFLKSFIGESEYIGSSILGADAVGSLYAPTTVIQFTDASKFLTPVKAGTPTHILISTFNANPTSSSDLNTWATLSTYAGSFQQNGSTMLLSVGAEDSEAEVRILSGSVEEAKPIRLSPIYIDWSKMRQPEGTA